MRKTGMTAAAQLGPAISRRSRPRSSRYMYHTLEKKAHADLIQSYRQTRDETVREVITAPNRLFDAAEIEEDRTKRMALLRALDQDIAIAVRRRSLRTYVEACGFVQEEAASKAEVVALRSEFQRRPQDPEMKGRMNEMSKQITTLSSDKWRHRTLWPI